MKIECGKCLQITQAEYLQGYYYKCSVCQAINDLSESVYEEKEIQEKLEKIKQGTEPDHKAINTGNLTVKEWSNHFNYQDYIGYILATINTNNFDDLRAENKEELEQGYLSDKQITKLKKVLKGGVENNWTLKQIADEIKKEVKPKDLIIKIAPVIENEEIIRNGYDRIISEDERTMSIARSEVTRSVNDGALAQYEEYGVERVRFDASAGSSRTCEICMGYDGEVFNISESYGFIPQNTHPMCRCSFSAIILEE